MGNGWINCGCGTVYTDAYGNPINTDSSNLPGTTTGGTASDTTGCAVNWGLIACAAIAAFVAISLAGKK